MIGLDPYRVPGPWDPAPAAEGVARGMTGLAEAGIDALACLVGLDGSDDVEAVVADALGRQTWDVVLVGGGIRRSDEELGLFEGVINLVHRLAPGAAIAFNRAPDELYAAAARWLPPSGPRTGGD